MRQNYPYESSPAARHYNSALSIWLSVDPMADKYPSTSPYTYCANNPVRLVDKDGERVFVFSELGRMTTKKYLRKYFKEQFGTSRIIQFTQNGEMILRKSVYEKKYPNFNSEQKKLIDGVEDAIKRPEKILVRIVQNETNVEFFIPLDNGNVDEYGDPVDYQGTSITNIDDLGGGGTMYSDFYNAVLVGVSDHIASEVGLSTGISLRICCVKIPILTGYNSSATFFHELLDEALFWCTNKRWNNDSPKVNRVMHQNAALQNLYLLPRDGMDHE